MKMKKRRFFNLNGRVEFKQWRRRVFLAAQQTFGKTLRRYKRMHMQAFYNDLENMMI